MAVGDFYKAVVKHTLGLGQDCVWDVHYRQLVTYITGNPAEFLANDLNDILNDASYRSLFMNSSILDRIEVTQQTGGTDFFNFTAGYTGTMTGEQLPPQCAAVCSMYTASFGRDQHGRIYLPPPNTGAVAGGSLSNAYQSSAQAWAVNLLTLFEVLVPAWQLVVFHRASFTGDDVTSIVVREDFGTQRRRVPGIGS